MPFASGPTSAMPLTRRFRPLDFLMSMWFPVALRCRTFPVLVTRNRLAAPRWVFIFGMPGSLPSFAPACEIDRPYCAASAGASAWASFGVALVTARLTGARTITMFRPSNFG